MLELFQQAIQPVNLPFTVFFALIMLYWLTVIAGLLDLSSFDIDLNLDPGVAPGALHGILAWLNLGEVPVMLFASIAAISMWGISITTNDLLNNTAGMLAAILAIPNIGISLLVARVVTNPFKRLFRRQEETMTKAIGSLCTLRDNADDTRLAEAIIETGGASIILNVRLRNGQSLSKGKQALVIEKDDREPDRDIYIVEPFDEWEL